MVLRVCEATEFLIANIECLRGRGRPEMVKARFGTNYSTSTGCRTEGSGSLVAASAAARAASCTVRSRLAELFPETERDINDSRRRGGVAGAGHGGERRGEERRGDGKEVRSERTPHTGANSQRLDLRERKTGRAIARTGQSCIF